MDTEFFCTTCEKLICKACVDAHSEENHHVRYYESYTKKGLVAKITDISKLYSQNQSTISAYDDKLTSLAGNILPKVKGLIAKMDEKIRILEKLEESLVATDQPKLMAYIEEALSNLDKNQKPSTLENFVEVVNEMIKLQAVLKQATSSGDALSTVAESFESLKKSVDGDSSVNYLLEVFAPRKQIVTWTLDPNCKHTSLTLSNNNMIVTKTGTVGNSSVIGTIGFKVGIHVWEVALNQVSVNSGNPGYWTAFGVIDKTILTQDKGADQANSISTSSYTGYLFNMAGTNPCLIQNSKCTVTLNCDEGVLTITGSGVDTKSVGSLKGKSLYPFFNLYNTSNSISIRIIK